MLVFVVQSLSLIWLDSLCSHGLQHARLPCPSLSPRVCSKSCPLSQWYYLAITSSATPFLSFRLQTSPISGFFPVSQLFESGGQSIGSSASESVLSMNIQGLFPLGLMDFISLLSEGLSNTTVQKHQFFSVQSSLWSNSHPYMTTGKTIALTIHSFVGKVMSLFFNTLLGLLIHRNKIDYSIFTFINLVRFIYFL